MTETETQPLKASEIVPFRQSYKARGIYLPRVTTILNAVAKPQLEVWKRRQTLLLARLEFNGAIGQTMTPELIDTILNKADREPERIAEEAADVGTRAHQAIFDINAGKKVALEDDIKPSVDAFLAWKKKTGIEILMGEQRVASLKYGYAGTLDAIGRIGKVLVLPDWKTSKGIYYEYAWQVGAYWNAWGEMYGEWAEKAFICRFPKTITPEDQRDAAWTPFEVKEIINIKEAFEAFLHIKATFDNVKAKWFL